MLRLTKTDSDENYPLSPQSSAVRKLKLRASVESMADLSMSYLIVKNKLATKQNGSDVVRNVGWGGFMAQNSQWQYPATCQIRTASLSIGGQVVEYNEDLHVRRVNMDVYAKSAERLRTEANYGAQGFQRLEGPKILTDAGEANMHSGHYMSPFVEESYALVDISTAPPAINVLSKNGASYKTVSSVIYLGDVFEFCKNAQAVNLAGKEIVVELQFEDRNTMLTEFVNYKTDLSTNPAVPQPYPYQTIAIDVGTGLGTPVTNGVYNVTTGKVGAFDPATYALGDTIYFRTLAKYKSVRDFPLLVGQPIALWLSGAPPAVVGSNIMTITQLLTEQSGAVRVYCKAISFTGGNYIRTAGAQVTAAQVAANIGGAPAAGGSTVSLAVAFSAINDPVWVAGANTTYTNQDAGASATYTVEGLELVIAEMPDGLPAGKTEQKAVQYIQYMRDVDTIPTGQLTYAKSFQLDPGCVAVFAMFPCTQAVGGQQTNMLSISQQPTVTEGLSWRNMIDGEALYSRDITFSMASDAVEPLFTHRLSLACQNILMPIENLVSNAVWMSHDGITAHAMIAEPVAPSEQPQQLAVRLNFTVNGSSRTIYVYKAVMKEFSL